LTTPAPPKDDRLVIHPAVVDNVAKNRCPKCLEQLDANWHCDLCGFDAIEIVHAMHPTMFGEDLEPIYAAPERKLGHLGPNMHHPLIGPR
jgi:hypothetical protein